MITANELMGLSQRHVVSFDNNQHFLQKATIEALHTMQKQASNSGIDIQVCSSFRSFDKQLSIWNRKWRGELPLNTLNGKQLNAADLSDKEKIHAIMLWSALPGASRHHWGTDFDVYDKKEVEKQSHTLELVPQEYTQGGPCAALSKWIQTHAYEFGFFLPYAKYCSGVAQEPWHMSYMPLAKEIEKNLNIDYLYATLEQADILGKQSILCRLPELVNRYTFNRGLDK